MNKIEQFKQALAKSENDFIALSPLPASKVQLRFIGRFNNEEVLWDATVQTLSAYNCSNNSSCKSDEEPATISSHPEQRLSFMQIDPADEKVYKLNVALTVPVIDMPTIKKTIIMIRGYKRLKLGCHVFGKNL